MQADRAVQHVVEVHLVFEVVVEVPGDQCPGDEEPRAFDVLPVQYQDL